MLSIPSCLVFASLCRETRYWFVGASFASLFNFSAKRWISFPNIHVFYPGHQTESVCFVCSVSRPMLLLRSDTEWVTGWCVCRSLIMIVFNWSILAHSIVFKKIVSFVTPLLSVDFQVIPTVYHCCSVYLTSSWFKYIADRVNKFVSVTI